LKLAFLGDSLTYGWLTEGVDAWNERFALLGAANFGVPGDLTDDVVNRIESGELDATQPGTIVLCVGTNDLGSGRTLERTVRGVDTCVRALLLRFAGTRVVLLGLLPRGDGGRRGYAQITAVNERLERLANQPRVRFFDCGAAFVDSFGRVHKELYDPDLLHLAPAGYAAWAASLDEAPLAS